jgi:hypothetical protein
MEGSGCGAFLSMGALLGEPGGEGGSFAWDSIGYERKALETGICLHGAQLGNLDWTNLPETLRGV